MSKQNLLISTDRGLYCSPGDFYVDPWRPVDRAIITHAHSDHARMGSKHYLAPARGEGVVRTRLGADASVQSLTYGESIHINGVTVSFHPAGHILGSAQVRVEYKGEVWVVSGDYKTEPDPTCEPFEPVKCHGFISEATFGLPIYRWPTADKVFDEVNRWWQYNQSQDKASVIFGYALGKAQRILKGINPDIGPIYTHGAVERLTQDYREAGVQLPPTTLAGLAPKGTDWSKALIVAPPSANGTPWLRRFGNLSTAFASGWMAIRGTRRRRAIDRGFILSDHADWPGLIWAIKQSEAERVFVTHGYVPVMVRFLQEQGIDAVGLPTQFEGELDETHTNLVAEAELSKEEEGAQSDAALDNAMVASALKQLKISGVTSDGADV